MNTTTRDAAAELCAKCGYTREGHIGNTGCVYPCWTPSGKFAPTKPAATAPVTPAAAKHKWINDGPDPRLPCTYYQKCAVCGAEEEGAPKDCAVSPLADSSVGAIAVLRSHVDDIAADDLGSSIARKQDRGIAARHAYLAAIDTLEAALRSPTPAVSEGERAGEVKRDREADRRRFPCPAFNDWLDTGISDCGHVVWHTVGDIADAWAGWEACVYRGERNIEADEAMVERAVDAYIKTGSSMVAALIEAFASVEQVAAAREAFRQVYDVESFADGTQTDNRDAAMRAALTAAIHGGVK